MNDILESAKNLTCSGEISHPKISNGDPVPLYDTIPGGINDAAGWNALAKSVFLRRYEQRHGRLPKSVDRAFQIYGAVVAAALKRGVKFE